jgi:hypothetical protein
MIRGRIAVATLALYGLLLQAFLAGLSPAVSGPLGSGICAASGPFEPGPSGQPHRDKGDLCCLLACGMGPPPLPVLSEASRPRPAIARSVQWTPAPALVARGPEMGAVGARGPPLV